MEQSQEEFRRLTKECIRKAEELYGIYLGRVTITFDLKSTCAGMAWCKPHETLGRTFAIQFNREAIRKEWDQMAYSTIPHEVAHLVAWAKPELKAVDHNRAWKKIAIALGDTSRGATRHTMDLKKRKKVIRHRYINSAGSIMDVPAALHLDIQAGARRVRCNQRVQFTPRDYRGITTG